MTASSLQTPFPTAAASTGWKAADYRVLIGTSEIGAAWKKTSAEGNPYLSVRLDDPSFPTPVFCRLVETQDGHRLMWSRGTKRRDPE